MDLSDVAKVEELFEPDFTEHAKLLTFVFLEIYSVSELKGFNF